MKKKLFIGAMLLATISCTTQKTVVTRYETTEARALDMTAKGYVKPVSVEVKVDNSKGRQKFSYDFDKTFVETDMKGDVMNLRNYVIFKACEEAKCDIIVSPTFHFFTNEKGGYTMEVVGFAGMFYNWGTITETDLQWINTTQGDVEVGEKAIAPIVKVEK